MLKKIYSRSDRVVESAKRKFWLSLYCFLAMEDFAKLVDTFTTLMGPKGCPWDRKQTMRSVRGDLLEECHELLEAISLDDACAMCEELGDVFACAVFLAKLAEKEGRFSLQEALQGSVEKLLRRHPHVFGEATVSNEAELLQLWERIKRSEKGKQDRATPYDGIPKGLPALARAAALQEKMMQAQHCPKSICGDKEVEVGEALWQLVGQARKAGVDAEEALRQVIAQKEQAARLAQSSCLSMKAAVQS